MGKKSADEQPQKKRRREYSVTPEEFIKAWQESETAQEVADKLGMPKPIVLARASAYRGEGVKLKKMRRENKRALDIDGLNRLIEQLAAGGSVEEAGSEVEEEAPPAAKPRKDARSTVKKLLKDKEKK